MDTFLHALSLAQENKWALSRYAVAELVSNFAEVVTKDPRDKIYAATGICRFYASIVPDYSLDFTEVSSQATMAMLYGMRTCTAPFWRVSHQRDHLPSWVAGFWSHHFHPFLAKAEAFNASTMAELRLCRAISQRLAIRGFVMDTVECSDISPEAWALFPSTLAFLKLRPVDLALEAYALAYTSLDPAPSFHAI
jgi:hypothetical protein